MPGLNLDNIDTGTFNVGEEEDNQLDVQLDDNVQVRANMDEALKVNPDEHAKVTDLSQQSDIPEFAVKSDPAKVEHGLKLDNIDFGQMSKRNPNTEKYLTDFNNSVIAQDDIEVLQSIEDIFDFGKTFKNIGETISLGFSSQAKGLLLSGADMSPERIKDIMPIDAFPPGMISPLEAELMSIEYAKNFGVNNDAELQEAKKEGVDKLVTDIRVIQEKRQDLTPEDLNLFETGVRSGIESLVNMAPSIGLAALTQGRSIPLTMIGAQTYSSSYGDARAEGKDPTEANWFASIDALIEVGTELLPTKTLENIITGKSKGLKKAALKFVVQEMGTEQLATLGQSLNAFAFGLDEEMENAKSIEEMINIQVRRQAITAIATVVAGGAQVTAATGIRKSIEALTQDDNKKETKGDVEQQKIDQLNEQSEKSKLRERDKESFKQFVNEADGDNNTNVFIDSSQVSLYMQRFTNEEIAADEALTLIDQQMREASETGVDVQVPVADFAAEIAGTDHYAELRDSMTMSDETHSPFRQEQVQQETETYVKNLMAEAEENASEYVEAQEIFTQVRDQLIDTGAVTPANASIMAQIVPAWATAQARRQGKTVQQVYQDSGLTIEGPQTGERARLEGEIFEQQDDVLSNILEEFETMFPELVDREMTAEEIEAADKITIGEDQGSVFKIQEAKDRRDELDLPEERTKVAGFTSERIGELLEDYVHANGVETRARVAFVDPIDFVAATHPDVTVIEADSRELDPEELTETGTPFLIIQTDGEIIGHEGRHRMMALAKAGYKSVPVVIQQPEYTSDSSDMNLIGQEFTQGKSIDLKIKNAVPVLPENVDQFTSEDADLLFQEDIASVEQRATLKETGAPTDEIFRQQDADRGRAAEQQAVIDEAKARTEEQGLAEYNRAKAGEEVTFVHRSQDQVDKLDDAKLDEVIEKRTPSAYLGHYLGGNDVGNAQRHGNAVTVHKFKLENPLEISEDAFREYTDGLTHQEAIDKREFLKAEGHDGILVEGLNWAIVFESETLNELQEDFGDVDTFFKQEQLDLLGDNLDESGQYTETPGNVQPTDEIRNQATITGRETIKQVDVGFLSLDTPAKVARATVSLSKSPQEKFWAITLDKDNKPLAILNHTMGVKNAASVDPAAVAGWAVSVEGATQVYFSHNHPSGQTILSSADKHISQKIANLLDGSGVESKGIMAVSPTEYSHETDDGPLPEVEALNKVDLVERTLEKVPSKDSVALTNPTIAKSIVKDLSQGDEGVVLLDNQHVPVGFLPFDFEKHGGQLRGGKLATLLKAVESTNASAVMLNVNQLETNEKNVANMLVAADMSLLDAFVDGASASESGLTITSGTTFKQEARGYYDPANSVIRLTEAADLSTFLHEFAHFMYEMEVNGNTEMLQDINKWYKRNADAVAKEANGYLGKEFDAEKQADVPTAKEGSITPDDVTTFLDNNTTGDKAKDAAIRRAVHEQFARGFEQYLMEGKAPSIELRNAFRTFARWLSRIYQALRGKLDVNIDAEMQQVFDRLLATEEQIQAAEARARVEPMFTDAAMAGMTEEEFIAYQKRQEKVKDVQSETLRDKIINQLTRQTKAWWKEEKQDIIDEEMESLSKQQVHLARERLKTPVSTKAFDENIAELSKELNETNKRIKKLTTSSETVQQFIARKGGLSRDFWQGEVDPQHFKDKLKGRKGKSVFPAKGGLTADDVAELLNQEDFNGGDLSANDVIDIVRDMLGGEVAFSDQDVTAEINALTQQADNIDREISTVEQQGQQANIKLDHATVKDMTGEEKTNKLGRTSVIVPPELRGMTAKGQQGVHPDEAAAFFGYKSGSEMLRDLITAPTIKAQAESNAEARMVEIHGDILTDGTIEQQADEALQNEERGELILSELKTLAKGTNAPTIERNTIKDLATTNIGKLSFREIHPGKYRKAEIRAAQESAAMLATGNREGAAGAKMRQVMNYYLGMAATDAKNDTVKIVDRMARYNKKKVREAIQKAEGGYWDQIVKILNRFEFRKAATLKEVESLNLWMAERNGEAGDALVLTNAVLNESYVSHWKNVPFSDLQGINDSVKNIEHVARYANKLTRMQEEIDFNKLVDRWVTSMDENVKTRFVSKRTDVVEGKKWGRWFMAQMTKIPFMASWLDGGERAGISHQIMVQPFTDAYNEEIKLWDKAGKPVMEMIENRDKADRKRHNQKIFIPEIDDNLFGHQIIAVALNTGNQGNLKKMLLGEGWANPDNEVEIEFNNPKLQAVLSHMTKGDWELVQNIWDQMDTLYPQLAEVHRRTTGLTPPKVEATPVETEFGTFKGGYYPVKYDPNRDHRAALNEDKLNAETESMFSNSASIQAAVNTGATNERTGYYAPIRLSLDVVPAHFQETIHYITHHDPIREVNRLTRNKQVAQMIKEKLGPEEYAQLRPWLNDIAKDGREAPVKMFWDDMLQRLRFGVTLGTMGFKASTGIIQVSGLSNTIAEVGFGNVMQSMRSILGSTTTIKQAWNFAVENSQVLEHRTQTMDREIKNAMKRIEGKRGVLAATQEVSMKHIALIQAYMVDLPSWHAAYIKGMKDWGDETRAFQYADWVIENVQGSGATKDMARVMRGQAETGRMFTMFMTFFSSLWNMERDLVKGAKSGRYSTTNVAAKAMFLFTIPVLFEMIMRGELGEPEDEDDRLQQVLLKTALFPVQSIPFIRDVASAVTGEFGYNISPLQAIIEQGTRTLPQLVEKGFTDEEITKGQAKGATKFIGATVGIPGMNQAWSTGEHLFDVIEQGEEFTLHQFLFGPKRD